MAGKTTKRKDNNRTVLKKGESQRKDGSYDFRWTDLAGKRHSVYAKTLTELREKEKEIDKTISSGLKHDGSTMTVDELFDLWFSLKRGIRDTTLRTYVYVYKYDISPLLGDILIKNLSFSHVKKAYIALLEEQGRKLSTIKASNQILMQALDFAVDDKLLMSNPAKKVFKEFAKETETEQNKKLAMTQEEQLIFLNFISSHTCYKKWANLMYILNGTGMRIGEALALQWEDINFEENTIDINKTMVYIRKDDSTVLSIHPTKTRTSTRIIPMSPTVASSFKAEKQYQKDKNLSCSDSVDGYNNFIFISQNGKPRINIDVDSVIRRMVASYNRQSLKKSSTPVFLPHISCHTFRHNFATRMFEAGVDYKTVQTMLGHSNIATTMNIYTDASKQIIQKEVICIDQFLTPKLTPIGT